MKKILIHFKAEWYKYILEILVITIGILGAFGLNSWNELRKASIQEYEILIGLKEEFTQNLEELNSDHHYNQLCLNATQKLLQQNGSFTPAAIVDSLFGHIINYATFDPRLGVVEEVISSGKLNFIQDEELRYRLTQWSGELDDLQEDVIIRREQYLQQLVPIYHKYVSSRNADATQVRHDYPRELVIEPKTYDQAQYSSMLTSTEFDGALYIYFVSQTWVVINEKQIKSFIEEVLGLIDENLSK